MKTILLILSLSLATPAYAISDMEGSAADYQSWDHFAWTNYDHAVHLLLGYSITLTGSLVAVKMGAPRVETGLAMIALVTLGAVVKEIFFDAVPMRTDIKMWGAGAISGGITFFTLTW